MLTDEIEQIGGLKNHRGGILIWMDADEPRSFQKGSFQKNETFLSVSLSRPKGVTDPAVR